MGIAWPHQPVMDMAPRVVVHSPITLSLSEPGGHVLGLGVNQFQLHKC